MARIKPITRSEMMIPFQFFSSSSAPTNSYKQIWLTLGERKQKCEIDDYSNNNSLEFYTLGLLVEIISHGSKLWP